MDKMTFTPAPIGLPPDAKYGHIRVSVAHHNAIARLARKCNISERKVSDLLLAFALKRVSLIEKPLYEMELRDINEDEEATADENQ